MITLPPSLAEVLAGAAASRVEAGEAGADVFRVSTADGMLYLKHGCGAIGRDVADEAARLAWMAGRIACPRVVQFVATDTAAWLLTEALPGRSGDEWLDEDPAHLPMVIDAAADLAAALHAIQPDNCPFDASARVRLAAARRRVAAGEVDEEDFDDDHAGWSVGAVLAATEALLPAVSRERVVTHGDWSLGNILIDDDGRAGCIDVGRLGTADRYQDLAIMWQNLADYGDAAQRRFLQRYGVRRVAARRLAFHRLLDELF